MAKGKGKKKGPSLGLELDKKREMERELQEALFQSGERGDRKSGVDDGGPGGGGASSTQQHQGHVKNGSDPGVGGDGGSTAGVGANPNPNLSPNGIPDLNCAGQTTTSDANSGNFERMVAGSAGAGKSSGVEGTARTRRHFSYAQAARGSRRSAIADKLQFVPDVNGDCIEYTSEDVAAASDDWSATMVGAIMGPAISSVAIINYIMSHWQVSTPKLFVKNNGILIFRFACEGDMRWVNENGPWAIGTSPLLLKSWIVGESMDWSFFKTVPVWTRILDPPPIFCSSTMLSKIGSGIGQPLCVDEYTANQEMVSFARMLIEINAEQARRKQVVLRNEKGVECKLKIVFEWLPWKCDNCCCFGHSASSCPVSKEDYAVGDSSATGKEGVSCPTKCKVGEGKDCKALNVDNPSGGAACGVDVQNSVDPLHTTSSHCTSSVGIQTEDISVDESEGNKTVVVSPVANTVGIADEVLNGMQSDMGCNACEDENAPTHVNSPCCGQRASNRAKSLACARLVASSWAAEAGIYANMDGELEINECKTPDDLMRWKKRSGVMRGAYRLRGTKARVSGDVKLSLTMDELFQVMSGIKDPTCGESDTAHFDCESDIDTEGDSSDEDYHPG